MGYGPPNLLQDILARGSAAIQDYRNQQASGSGGYGGYNPAAQSLDLRGQVLSSFQGRPTYNVQPGGSDVGNRLADAFATRYLAPGQTNPIVYGNQTLYGTGKTKHPGQYAGFNTSSDLWNAIEGRGVMSRRGALAEAGQLQSKSEQGLSALQKLFDTQQQNAVKGFGQEWQQRANVYQHGDVLGKGTNSPSGVLNVASDTERPQAEYEKNLRTWLGTKADPLAQAIDAAHQIQQVPLSTYEAAAGAQYGVDPNIVQGRFGDQQDVTDYMTQRNMAAIQNYGIPYSEVVSLANQAQGDQADAAKAAGTAADAAAKQQAYDEIYQTTGQDADQLAASANVTPEQLYQVVNTPDYQSATSALQQHIQDAQDAGNDPEALAQAQAAFEDTLRQVGAADPVLYQVLQAQFSPYGASASDFFSPSTVDTGTTPGG